MDYALEYTIMCDLYDLKMVSYAPATEGFFGKIGRALKNLWEWICKTVGNLIDKLKRKNPVKEAPKPKIENNKGSQMKNTKQQDLDEFTDCVNRLSGASYYLINQSQLAMGRLNKMLSCEDLTSPKVASLSLHLDDDIDILKSANKNLEEDIPEFNAVFSNCITKGYRKEMAEIINQKGILKLMIDRMSQLQATAKETQKLMNNIDFYKDFTYNATFKGRPKIGQADLGDVEVSGNIAENIKEVSNEVQRAVQYMSKMVNIFDQF